MGAMISGIDSIDTYQRILREIAYISKSPLKFTERTFVLTCLSAHDQISTNEIHLRVRLIIRCVLTVNIVGVPSR